MSRIRYATLAASIAPIVPLMACGPLIFHNPRWVDNDPLTNAVAISDYDGRVLTLEDGRRYYVHAKNDQKAAEQLRAGSRVELEASEGMNPKLFVSVRDPMMICGTPYMGVTIPLITDDFPNNARRCAGSVTPVRVGKP